MSTTRKSPTSSDAFVPDNTVAPCASGLHCSPHRTFFSPVTRAEQPDSRRRYVQHFHSRAPFYRVDSRTIGAQANNRILVKMFSTWSATEDSSAVVSSDSPSAKRRRLSSTNHGRRTSKATRACDVCKVILMSLFTIYDPSSLVSLAIETETALLAIGPLDRDRV
jgi:hypothetical protein